MLNGIRKQQGFSLAEMAIVLVIIGILLASGLGALSGQLATQRSVETKQMLERANEALLGFALANNHLPCPADPALANTDATAGQEERQPAGDANAYRCVRSYGDLPWRDLGLPELDAWGRRLKYAVATNPTGGTASYTGDFAGSNPTPGTTCGLASNKPCFTLQSGSNLLTLRSATRRDGVAVTSRVLVNNAVVVIFSEGEKGNLSTTDENENRNGDTSYRCDTPDLSFDDLMTWLPNSQLLYLAILARKLP
ncbi:type II secretion system protein [Chitinibacter fontanus]|uniref:Type II secretion system protein n=1 Tax=Chitinibacter fontanus TaxID=1737446 RepID=A0A7D5V8U9_9NEIS|nr:type II secretion system protein [Chitinibacter fontanus]QLI80991.1 type II secretion system protein [Chitinibacter fontanus]